MADEWRNNSYDEIKEFWKNPHEGLSKYWKSPNDIIYEVSENSNPENPRSTDEMLSTYVTVSDNLLVTANGRRADCIDSPNDVRFNEDDPHTVSYLVLNSDPDKSVSSMLINNILTKVMPDEDIDKALRSYVDKNHLSAEKNDFEDAFHAIKTGKDMPEVFAGINSATPLLDMAEAGTFKADDYVHFLEPEKPDVGHHIHINTAIGAFITKDDVKQKYGEVTPDTWKSADATLHEEHQMDFAYSSGECYLVDMLMPEKSEFDEEIEMTSLGIDESYGQQVFNIIPSGSEYLGAFENINECVQDLKNRTRDAEKTQFQEKPSLDDILKDAESKADSSTAKGTRERDDDISL